MSSRILCLPRQILSLFLSFLHRASYGSEQGDESLPPIASGKFGASTGSLSSKQAYGSSSKVQGSSKKKKKSKGQLGGGGSVSGQSGGYGQVALAYGGQQQQASSSQFGLAQQGLQQSQSNTNRAPRRAAR
jgi:hypothetical protein